MKSSYKFIGSIAASLLVCAGPGFCVAQSTTTMRSSDANAIAQAPDARLEARQMVPARAEFMQTLDAQKLQKGSAVEARLDSTVRMNDGVVLPGGTMLIGEVTHDRTMSNGKSRLALRFTAAKLKDGGSVPITATIVGLSGPAALTENVATFDGPLPWRRKYLGFQEIGDLSGVDMHSRIGATNSATLVAANRSDLKVPAGSRMSLAMGASSAD